MEVTSRCLDNVVVCHTLDSYVTTYNKGQELLSNCGRFYLVALAQNDIPGIRERMREKFNMNSRVRAIRWDLASLICPRLHCRDGPEESVYSSYAFIGAEMKKNIIQDSIACATTLKYQRIEQETIVSMDPHRLYDRTSRRMNIKS